MELQAAGLERASDLPFDRLEDQYLRGALLLGVAEMGHSDNVASSLEALQGPWSALAAPPPVPERVSRGLS